MQKPKISTTLSIEHILAIKIVDCNHFVLFAVIKELCVLSHIIYRNFRRRKKKIIL